jgi:hypothetical protein
VDQFPKEGVSVDRNHPITLKIGNSGHKNKLVITQGSMPNLVGLTLREAMQRAAKEGVGIKIKGSELCVLNQCCLEVGSSKAVFVIWRHRCDQADDFRVKTA